jgi:radical SAM superfamily enzyme YgiQ (UPF0313 family)
MPKATPSLILVMPPQKGLLNGFANGLASIADFVRGKLPTLPVHLYDLSQESIGSTKAAILRRGIPLTNDTVVGITTTTASYYAALHVAAAFKELAEVAGLNITTIFGGHHAGSDAEVVLRAHRKIVDYVVIGEGEVAMIEFLRSYPDVRSTPGLAFLNGENYSANRPAAPLSQVQLDSIPIALENNGTLGVAGKFGHITYVSARGCPLGCAFCAVGNQRIRAKSVPRVINDVRQLVSLGYSRIAIEDNFFAHTLQRTKELCEALIGLRHSGLEFTWDCQTRVESMDREGLVELLERAGCDAVYLGVESLNPDQLRYLNKTPNPENYLDRLQKRVVPALLASNVQCYINLQFGLPGETDEHHARTKEILKTVGARAKNLGKTVTIFPQLHVVYPGTAHFQQGLLAGKYPRNVFEKFTAWEAMQAPVLNWLGRHFAHGTGGIPVGILNPRVLQSGRFAGRSLNTIDPDAITRIDSILSDLDQMDGIEVFKYGKYLAGEEISSNLITTHQPKLPIESRAACGG